jgi:hypothetical protein
VDIQYAEDFLSVYITNVDIINVREYRRDNQNEKSRETDTILYASQRQQKHMHNTICCRHHYPQANTNNVNKTSALSMEINKIAGKKLRPLKFCNNII